jgi:ubiquinone/menaquinone biosynthesis C-methylase UbiE
MHKKKLIWTEIAHFIHQQLNKPNIVLDPAGGLCEFINAVPAGEKWAIDLNEAFLDANALPEVKKIIGNNLEVDIPDNYFEGVFISNFLEHLHSQEEVALFLGRMYSSIKPGGRIAIIGPNFKYTYKEYFDFADHTVILSELGVAEHLYGAGFKILKIYPRFLPLSFRGKLPVNRFLASMYLKMPFAWRFLGKQFLLVAEK